MEEERELYQRVRARRDISFSGPPSSAYLYRPRHYILDPAMPSTSRDPHYVLSPRPPPGPLRIRSPVERAGRVKGVVRERSRSPNPYYTPGMYSTRGHLSVMVSTDDEHTTISAASGYMMRVLVVREEGEGTASGGARKSTAEPTEDTTEPTEEYTPETSDDLEDEGEGTLETVIVVPSDESQNRAVVVSSQ